MKSLHQFMAEKNLELAERIDADPPASKTFVLKTTSGQPVKYRLISIPLYLAGRIVDLIDKVDG